MQDIERKLYKYQEYKRRISELEKQIDEIQAMHDSRIDWMLSAPKISDIKVKGGPLPDPVFKAVQQMVDMYGARIDSIRCELVDVYYLYDEIAGMVTRANLTEQEREYVQLRYFEGLRPGLVASRMNYSEKQARRVRVTVLEKIK